MNKLKTFVTKHDNIFVFLLLFIITAGFIFRNAPLEYDSLWVFGNLSKLSHGFRIYEEVNIVTFPLFYETFGMLLSLFNNYLGFLILNFLVVTPLYFMVYQLFKACNVKKNFALLFTMLNIIVTRDIVAWGPSYNTLALLLYIIGMWAYLKKKDSKFSFIIQGVLAFLVLMCNQKFGAAYIASLFLLHIFNIKSEKKSIIKLLKTYLVTFILCALFVLVLFLTNRLNAFLDMTILGLGSFTKNYSFNMLPALYLLGILGFLVFCLICVKKKYNNYTTLKTLICFSFTPLIVVYPIFNDYHFLVFFTIFSILILYSFYNLFEKLIDNKFVNKIINILSITALLVLLINGVSNFITWNTKHIKAPGDIFYGAILPEQLQIKVTETSEYINSLKEKNINYRVLSNHAMYYTLYDVPEKNNGYFDMPLRGNLGKDDWHSLINTLNQEPEGTYIIIDRKIDGKFGIYQFPEEVFNYVNDNYAYIQDIGFYSVYKK